MQTLPAKVPELPADVAQAIAGKDGSTTSTLLAVYRTQLAVRRTGLADLRSHLANERTHLAYLRTAIALISFGITLNRFSVFLQQEGTAPVGEGVRHTLRDAGNVGIGMVLLGLLLVMWSLYRFWRVNRDIHDGDFRPLKGSVVTYTLLVILLGGLSAVWLFNG
ncbi:MAG: YidH family protein [Rhodanobacteraceae bacterium]